MAELIPGTTPQGLLNLIQTNWLVRVFYDALRPFSYFRLDARQEKLVPGTGQTATYSKLGNFNVDLAPLATALATPPVATFSSEQYTAKPEHFANSFVFDGMTAYVQSVGSTFMQGISRLAEWAGRTQSRKARQAIYKYGGGSAISRRQQVATNTVMLLNTLAGFRQANTVSGLVPVSSTTALDISIGGTANTVTGVAPINALYPDGPGAITLGTPLAGTVTAQTPVTALNGPKIFRPNARASSELIVATDNPTVQDLMSMRTRMFDLGIPKHPDNTFHLHADAVFLQLLSKDDQWKTATQAMGPSDAFGVPGGTHLPLLGLTIFETNDSPAVGRGQEVAVGSLTGGPGGSTGVEPSGAVGSPGSSSSMQDLGLDVKNSTGIPIRRAVMTGANALIETYVDIMDYWAVNGIRKIADVSSYVSQYAMGGTGFTFFAFEVEGWIVIILPALDPRQLQTTITIARTFDYTLDTDLTATTGGNNGTALNQNVPLKRAAVMEYSFVGA
jgi:hypothetical protein